MTETNSQQHRIGDNLPDWIDGERLYEALLLTPN